MAVGWYTKSEGSPSEDYGLILSPILLVLSLAREKIKRDFVRDRGSDVVRAREKNWDAEKLEAMEFGKV